MQAVDQTKHYGVKVSIISALDSDSYIEIINAIKRLGYKITISDNGNAVCEKNMLFGMEVKEDKNMEKNSFGLQTERQVKMFQRGTDKHELIEIEMLDIPKKVRKIYGHALDENMKKLFEQLGFFNESGDVYSKFLEVEER